MVRLTQWHSEVKLSLGVFQTNSSLITKLALFRDTERKRKPEGRGLETSAKVNLGRKWVETEDEGKSSCEKLWAVLAVLLVVAVCQNTPSEIQIPAKVQKTGFSDLRIIFRRPVR